MMLCLFLIVYHYHDPRFGTDSFGQTVQIVNSEIFAVIITPAYSTWCDIGVQLSIRPSVNFLSTINFSVPMIPRIMKPCIVILLDILYKHAP